MTNAATGGNFRRAEGNPELTGALRGRPLEEITQIADKIRKGRGLPEEIMFDIFGDMAILTDKMAKWPCTSFWSYGQSCPHGTPQTLGRRDKITCEERALLPPPPVVEPKPKVAPKPKRNRKPAQKNKPTALPERVYDPDELIGEALPRQRITTPLIG